MINSKSKISRELACSWKHLAGANRSFSEDGFTLIEVMVAVSITIVMALGTLCYQYYGVKHSRASQAQITATRIGQLILEDWKSTGGDPDYDPLSLGLGFASLVPPNPGHYLITLDNQTIYITRTQQLAAVPNNPDTVAGVTLNQIHITVKWRKDYGQGATTVEDPEVSLITFVRRDG
jgi:prepilin-type N-terminal cleavage/methylation domain-containing protein